MDENQQQIAQTALLAGVVGQVGCVTALVIGLALGGGFLLDRLLDTRPIFTILFLVGSVPVTLYTIVRVTTAAMMRAQQRINAAKKKEETRE